ncbi:MAG: hypothetical protein COV66_08000 [Nitrospinae bacterium CG11_big_fil_rev_8_21_14_0_20_45_15]|nr:MAG: hypothetical protein COV66_08000 [Nitrospinae bacterium CG11_big_fil_rev_8_21_14_0_20_45_15]
MFQFSMQNEDALSILADDLNRRLQNVEQETASALAESAERLARERVLDLNRKPNPKSGNYHQSIKATVDNKSAFYIAELSSNVPYAGALEFGFSRKKNSSKTKMGFRVLGDAAEEAVNETDRIFTEIFKRQSD